MSTHLSHRIPQQQQQQQQSQPQLEHVDCVIIGAGAAGLQTAANLIGNQQNDQPISFVILEARDRIGGRIYTTKEQVSTVDGEMMEIVRDLGAAWIHGTRGIVNGEEKKNPMVELLEEIYPNKKAESLIYPVFPGNAWTRPDSILHRLGNVALFLDGTEIYNDSPVVAQSIRRHYDLLEKLAEYADALYENGEGYKINELSVDEVRTRILQDNKLWQTANKDELVESLWPFYLFLIENWNGISIGDIQLSLLVGSEDNNDNNGDTTSMITDENYKCEGDFNGPHCKVKDGISSLLIPLLHKVGRDKINLNETVVSVVNHESQGIRVETASGTTINATCCVSTIPLGCLQATAEQVFQPNLSKEKIEAIQSIWSGSYKKVFLTFNHVFWPKHIPFIGLIRKTTAEESMTDTLPGNHLLLTNLYAKDGIPSIEAVLCGEMGNWGFQKSDEEICFAVVSFIESSMGIPDLHESCVECHVTRWEEDPFTRGSFSTFCLGTKECHVEDLAVPEWDGKLCFAGEPTELEHMGSVHAALMSGDRAAQEVLTYLRRKDILSGSHDKPRTTGSLPY
jgi:monoamine oxidase